MKGRVFTLNYRRKRKGKTNYKRRLNLIKSGDLRVVVRKGLNNFLVQLTEFNSLGDKILVSSSTRELIKYGWKAHRGNLSSAYLVGFLSGLKAKKKGLKSGILDLGLYRAIKNSSFFAVAKGLKDAGFDIPVSESVLPTNRVLGKHIEDYAKKLKGTPKYQKQFSKYLKSGINPEELSKHVGDVKNKITEKWR